MYSSDQYHFKILVTTVFSTKIRVIHLSKRSVTTWDKKSWFSAGVAELRNGNGDRFCVDRKNWHDKKKWDRKLIPTPSQLNPVFITTPSHLSTPQSSVDEYFRLCATPRLYSRRVMWRIVMRIAGQRIEGKVIVVGQLVKVHSSSGPHRGEAGNHRDSGY